MALAATAAALLASGEGAGLGGRRDNIGMALVLTVGLAIAARLVDIVLFWWDHEDPETRCTVAFIESVLIGCSLLALGWAMYQVALVL